MTTPSHDGYEVTVTGGAGFRWTAICAQNWIDTDRLRETEQPQGTSPAHAEGTS
ncbi:hypothetical protein MAUB1S_04582 [Mycolicibacterium aubagnense]